METSAFVQAVVEQTSIFADWVTGEDASAPVPTCPKWTLAELVNHVGGTQREMALLVRERMSEPSKAFASYVPGPADSTRWGAWLTEGTADVAEAFGSVTDDTPVWDPYGKASGVTYWSRRLFGEACVHRADAAAALDRRFELEPDLAVAAIDDWLDNITSPVYWDFRADFAEAMRGQGETLHFRAADAAGEWLARRESDKVALERRHAEADVTVSGPATELLLVLSRRLPRDAAPDLEVRGDDALLDLWIEHMDWVTD